MGEEGAGTVRVWILSAEDIARGLHDLSDELKLTPAQAAVVLQTTTDQLASWRVAGGGPRFLKMGEGPKAPVRYRLGELRAWERANTFANTSEASVCRFGTLGALLSRGSIDDVYPVAIEAPETLWDFWESVRAETDIADVRWMRADALLDRFHAAAFARETQQLAETIGTEIRDPGLCGAPKTL